jgi:phage shock protein PspC (stress-responsive transcriptional regulator)
MIAAMTDRSARLLRRRSADRVIGGVAGGLGDYFNIDPLLVRIGFVALIIFGGAGLVLYLIAWLLLPAEGHDASMLEIFLRRLGLTSRRIVWIALAVVAVLVVQAVLTPGGYLSIGPGYPGPGTGLDATAVWAVAVIVVGILLLRRRETVPAMAVASTDAAQFRVPALPAVPRPPSPLAWYVFAAVLVAIGLLAIASQVAKVEVEPGQFFGAALGVIGIGLVVGAWWGRARILIMLALLLLPMAVTAGFMTAPLEGGLGDQRYAPANAAELRGEYRLMGGRLVLDLTGLSIGAQPIHIAASVAVGQLLVLMPPGVSVQLQARVGAGSTIVFGSREVGTSLEDRYVRHQPYGPTYILDLEAGIGDVQVVTDAGTAN